MNVQCLVAKELKGELEPSPNQQPTGEIASPPRRHRSASLLLAQWTVWLELGPTGAHAPLNVEEESRLEPGESQHRTLAVGLNALQP